MDPFETFLEMLAVSLLAMIGYLLVVFFMLEGGPH